MSIATYFCDPLAQAQPHFGAAALEDECRTCRVVQMAAGWTRQPGANKVAYWLLDQFQATPGAFQ